MTHLKKHPLLFYDSPIYRAATTGEPFPGSVLFGFVSDLEFRVSDFEFQIIVALIDSRDEYLIIWAFFTNLFLKWWD
jgi:hypothetical protein